MATTTQDSVEAPISEALAQLRQIFENSASKHEAHETSRPVVAGLASDPAFLTAVLARHLRAPDALDRLHYPVVAFGIDSNPHFDLVANAWIPLPDGRTDVTTKAIHHHGELLLTTATMFGPGYEHWMLAAPELVDGDRRLYRLDLLEHGIHSLHEVAFVDSGVAHVPLYPESLTITLCLWSSRQATTWRDTLKRMPALQRRSASLRRLVTRAGLDKQLQVKNVEYFDFYPAEGGFIGIQEREEFPRGPTADYLYSLFHIVQRTGNAQLAPVIERRLAGGDLVAEPALVRELLGELERGEPIPGRLSTGHYNVTKANFTRADIEQALAGQAVRS